MNRVYSCTKRDTLCIHLAYDPCYGTCLTDSKLRGEKRDQMREVVVKRLW